MVAFGRDFSAVNQYTSLLMITMLHITHNRVTQGNWRNQNRNQPFIITLELVSEPE